MIKKSKKSEKNLLSRRASFVAMLKENSRSTKHIFLVNNDKSCKTKVVYMATDLKNLDQSQFLEQTLLSKCD